MARLQPPRPHGSPINVDDYGALAAKRIQIAGKDASLLAAATAQLQTSFEATERSYSDLQAAVHALDTWILAQP